MAGFTKLFSEIVTSSIWSEDDKTRIVWVTMLALAGPDGIVRAALPGLANASRVTLEDCERAITKFIEPDPYSRSQGHEGRRVERVEGGYYLLNYSKYRLMLSSEERRIYKANKQAEYRSKKKNSKSGKTQVQVRAQNEEREIRYVQAYNDGDESKADQIAAEGI